MILRDVIPACPESFFVFDACASLYPAGEEYDESKMEDR